VEAGSANSKVYGRKPGGMGKLTVVMRRAGLGGYNRFLVLGVVEMAPSLLDR
jgi:hypothetical protein